MGPRAFSALVALVAVTGCGVAASDSTPSAPSVPPSTNAPTAAPDVPRCTGTPFDGRSGTANPRPDDAGRANALAAAHPDIFAGMWWDGAAATFVFPAVDVERARQLVTAELPGGAALVEPVARSATEMAAVQARARSLVDAGLEVSTAGRVWDGIVEIGVPILDEATLDAVRELYADDLSAICVTGADPATVPPDGPQPTGGDGWRLLADAPGRGQAYTAAIARTDDEYAALWTQLALGGERPPVDLTTEVVVHFGAVYSGSCPEIRLEGVDVRAEPPGVHARIVRLGGNRACTDDANPRAYVLAIARNVLPATPFELAIEPDCAHCGGIVVADEPPAVPPDGGLVPGEPTVIDIYAHCGVRVLGNVNGQWWVTDEPGSDTLDWLPVEWALPPGEHFGSARAVLVLSVDGSTIAATRGGRVVTYRPAGTDLDAIGGGCA